MALQHFRIPNGPAEGVKITGGEHIAALVVPWHTEFERSGQTFVFTADSLTIPSDLATIKLLVEHDAERPVGYAVDANANTTGLNMEFALPAHNPRVSVSLLEFADKLRDGFSIGVEPSEETLQAMFTAMMEGPADTVPFSGTLREVSLVTLPEFNDARGSLETKANHHKLVTLATTKDRNMPDTLMPTVAETVATFNIAESPEFAEMAGRLAALESGTRGGAHSLARFGTLADAIKAGLNSETGRVKFVLADNTSNAGANAGVVPPSWLSTVVGVIARRRRVIEAFGGPGNLPADGFTTNWPYYDGDLSTLVGIQATQKADITSAAVDIKNGQAPVKTYAGGADNALQLIERSSPAFLEVWGRIMAAAYGVVTDKDFAASVYAGGTGTSVIDWATAVTGDVKAWLFDASDKVDDATGAPAEFALVAPDIFMQLGNMENLHNPSYGTNNIVGTSSAATLEINVNGLPVYKAKGLAAGQSIVSNSEAARFMEDGPSFIDALNVAKLGRDSAIYGYGAAHIYIPAGIVKGTAVVAGRSGKA